jgi:tetratricopeptide (TPR) repeat protein
MYRWDRSAYTWSGRSIALAVSTDGISTSSPEAKEWFFKGLTASTQYARYNESLDYFDQALMIDSNFTEAWYAKGVALHNMMRYDEAIHCYSRALAIDPGNAAVLSLKKAAQVDWERRNASAKSFHSV